MKTIAYLTLTGLAHVQSAHIRGSNGAAAVADPAQVAAAIDAHDKEKYNIICLAFAGVATNVPHIHFRANSAGAMA